MGVKRSVLKKAAEKIAEKKKKEKKEINIEDIELPETKKSPLIEDIGDALKEFEVYQGENDETQKLVQARKDFEQGDKQTLEEKRGKAKPTVIDFSKIKGVQSTVPIIVQTQAPVPGKPAEEKLKNIPMKAHKIPKQYIKTMSSAWKPPSFDKIDLLYPLIKPYAMVNMKWNKKENKLNYFVLEPELTAEQKVRIESIKELVVDLLDVNLFNFKEATSIKKILKDKIDKVITDYGMKMTKHEYEKILYYIYRDFLGLSKIEPLMHDPNIEDISCDGINIPLYIYHRKYASIPSNITFDDEEKLNRFIIRLAQRCGKHISVAEPLLDGALPDGSRVQATFSSHKDIAMHGSTFTIRKFTKDPLTITDMLKFGTVPEMMAAYLWIALEYRRSILVAGGTASGKTSLLNSLSMFLPEEEKIVSIEDTPEIRLPHEHWLQKVVRTGFGRADLTGRKQGEISMYDLLRAALRERPDELIVGEVRGKEAYVLFQGMASIRGNEKIIYVDDKGMRHKKPIKELAGKDLNGYTVPTINPKTKKCELLPLENCVEHDKRKELYEITTMTGRKIQLTGDHSVFTQEKGVITEAVVSELKKNDEIIIPSKLPSGYNNIKHYDLTQLIGVRVKAPSFIKQAVKKIGYKKANALCKVKNICDYYKPNYCSALEFVKYTKLLQESGVCNSKTKLKVKFDRKSKDMNALLPVNNELLKLIGYYVSEGSLNTAKKNNSIQLYNSDKKVLSDMKKCIKKVCGETKINERKTFGYGSCTEISFNNKVIYEFLKQECGHKSKEKKIPDFVFGLTKNRIGKVLESLYTGDGYSGKKMIQYSTTSRELAEDVNQMLLAIGITAHLYKQKNMYRIEFYRQEEKELFYKYAKPIGKPMKSTPKTNNPKKTKDVYLDKIKTIKKILLKPEHVYDLVVPGTQNFIGGFGGIMLHNTGHAGMATIHGDSVDAVMHRLQTPPINLSAGLLQHLNVIIVLTKARIKGIEVRRIKEVVEVLGVSKEQEPIVNTLFKWNPSDDTFEFSSDKSYVLQKIIEDKGIEEKSIWEEVQRRTQILRWMKKNDIRYYMDVGKIIQQYYSNPEEVLKNI